MFKRYIFFVCAAIFAAPVPAPAAGTCVKVLKTIVTPILFEPAPEVKPQTRAHGFLVERPKDKDNWASRIWRHYPRKISRWMINDDNFVFAPLHPFPGRQLVWLYNFISGDWALRKISKFFVGAPYTLSRYVTIPLVIWSISGMPFDHLTAPADPIAITQAAEQHQAGAVDYQFLPTDHALIQRPQADMARYDLRAQIYRENGGDPAKMQKVFDDYYHSAETATKLEPQELFGRVNALVNQLPESSDKAQMDVKAVEATHMLYFRLRLLDELYYFPSVFNAQKKIAIDSHEVALSEFMTKIELTDNFLQSAKDSYLAGWLSDEQLLHFSQQYVYDLYILELGDILHQDIVKEQFGIKSPLTLADMTLSLKTEMQRAMDVSAKAN